MAALLSQQFRGHVHYTFGIAAGAVALYNLGRWALTHRWGHLGNVIIYAALAVIERRQMLKHEQEEE